MTVPGVKKILFGGSTGIIALVLGFVCLLNINQDAELRKTFLLYAGVLLMFSAGAFWFFSYKGIFFNTAGRLERSRVIMMLMSLLVIVQITFIFGSYAYRQMAFSFSAYDSATALYRSLDWNEPAPVLEKQLEKLPDEIDELYVLDSGGDVVYSKPALPSGAAMPGYPQVDKYFFPLSAGGSLEMHLSKSYQASIIRKILLDLFTVMVVSLFFAFELVLFIIRIIDTKLVYVKENQEEQKPRSSRSSPDSCVNFIRQVSFLFYFAFCFTSVLIPMIASQLAESSGNGTLAGIPLSAEILFTSMAIFLTSECVSRFGWKQPFLFGIVFIVAGTVLSALTGSLVIFALSRAIVGTGYGFCWMTLRGITLFGKSEKESTWAFSMFLAGLYAGKNCGQMMGSILAESMGYGAVLVFSAIVVAISGIIVLFLKNERVTAPPEAEVQTSAAAPQGKSILAMIVFILLLALPASAVEGGFAPYYVPLFMKSIGMGTADTGRLLLLYSLVMVYLGPKIAELYRKTLGSKSRSGHWYNIFFSVALIFCGISGGLGSVAVTIVIMALADGFGFGVQKDTFLSLSKKFRIFRKHGLSWYSFIVKLAAMLGPIIFGLVLEVGKLGILFTGIAFMGMAVLAGFLLRVTSKNEG